MVELLVVIVIIGILAALLLPAVTRAIRNTKITKCASNMRQLWQMQINYATQFGGTDRNFPVETCQNFWIKLGQTNPSLIDTTLKDIFACPLEGNVNAALTTDYRGPNANINGADWKDGDPVGSDRGTNHGSNEGGNVLRKSGDVTTLAATDALWALAGQKLCPP